MTKPPGDLQEVDPCSLTSCSVGQVELACQVATALAAEVWPQLPSP